MRTVDGELRIIYIVKSFSYFRISTFLAMSLQISNRENWIELSYGMLKFQIISRKKRENQIE